MSVKIFGKDTNLSQQITKIITHYFHQSGHQTTNPHPNKGNQIFINTKYYICKVPIELIEDLQDIQVQENNKTDMVIFAFDEKQQIEGIKQKIDKCINKLCPQASIICVNSQISSQCNNWHHQEQIAECQNFVPVVYENFYKIGKDLPQWTSNSLLKQNDEDVQIFTLLDLIETTSWTNILKKTTDSKSQAKSKHEQNKSNGPQINTISKVSPQKAKPKQQTQQSERKNVSQENHFDNKNQNQDKSQDHQQQVDEQQMQKQMMEFQQLMQQMMAVKSMPMSSNDRKNKAEQLIMKLAKSMGGSD